MSPSARAQYFAELEDEESVVEWMEGKSDHAIVMPATLTHSHVSEKGGLHRWERKNMGAGKEGKRLQRFRSLSGMDQAVVKSSNFSGGFGRSQSGAGVGGHEEIEPLILDRAVISDRFEDAELYGPPTGRRRSASNIIGFTRAAFHIASAVMVLTTATQAQPFTTNTPPTSTEPQDPSASPLPPSNDSQTTLPNPDDPTFTASIGLLISWLCCFLYLSSRLPQIHKNYMRKSVTGLSIKMFLFAALGNLTYAWSILVAAGNLEGEAKGDYMLQALPFLLGSVGTLTSDVTIFVQHCWYSKTDV